MAIHNAIEYPVDLIREWIDSGWTQAEIADRLCADLDPRISAKLIYKVCKRHGIKCQRTGPRSGEGHPEWKGGRVVNSDGYIEIYCPDHPNRRKHTKYILEHRLVMESVIGRYLTKTEVVHHKNGDKQDNRPENLEVFESNAKHLEETLVGKVPKWTADGLRRIRSAPRPTMPEQSKGNLRRRGKTVAAIRTALGSGVFPNTQTIDRYLKQHGITFEQACEMVSQRVPLPSSPRSKR